MSSTGHGAPRYNRGVSEEGKLNVACPECGAELVVDVASAQVIFHKAVSKPPAGGKDFEDLLANLDASKAHADEVFSREVSAFKDRDRLLEEKFREALKHAEEAGDEEPPLRPWDLD